MIAATHPSDLLTLRRQVGWMAFAFAYWVLFMAALTPGNLFHALAEGVQPDPSRVAIRLAGAGVLGAAVNPLLLVLACRWPVSGEPRWRHLAIQGVAVVVLAPAMVAVSCLLVAWLFEGRLVPTWETVARQVLADWALLVFRLGLLLMIVQGARARTIKPQGWAERLTIGERGRLRVVEMSAVEWIETQGNYQALHAQGEVHLLRDTSKGLETRLDPRRFVRIHRRFIVAAERVREVEPLANGDAIVRLASGAELRQSRQHRAALRAALQDRAKR